MFNFTVENLEGLLPLQRDVNRKVNEKLAAKPTAGHYILAFNIELYEFMNAVGTWKWWKHSHQIDKARILDELADCYAFFLSVALTLPAEIKDDDEHISYPRRNMLEVFLEVYKQVVQATTSEEKVSPTDLITLIGTSSELQGDKHIDFMKSFAIAHVVVGLLWPEITWEEIADAYRAKSKVNMERQENNY